MIVISDSLFQISEIAGEYVKNSVQRQLLEQMSQSSETYRYGSLDQLKFELSLRGEIVDGAKALSRSGLSFAIFHKTKCNEAYWERTSNGGFRLKSGVKPSDAINDIFKNGKKYATECATAMVIVYYRALLHAFRAERFDRQFPSIYLMDWHRLDPLLREGGKPRKVADILPGDRCYFKNPDVDPKTPEWQGENVIVLPNGLYYGHGLGIADADSFIRALNTSRKEGATQSAYFMKDYAARLSFKRLEEAFQELAAQLPQPVAS